MYLALVSDVQVFRLVITSLASVAWVSRESLQAAHRFLSLDNYMYMYTTGKCVRTALQEWRVLLGKLVAYLLLPAYSQSRNYTVHPKIMLPVQTVVVVQPNPCT